MEFCDGVDLPFCHDVDGSSVSQQMRFLSDARARVLAELNSDAKMMASRRDAEAEAAEKQALHARLYRSFRSEMDLRCPMNDITSPSPVSGVSSSRGDVGHWAGELEVVSVAAPPRALRCSTEALNKVGAGTALNEELSGQSSEEEKPLLTSSAPVSQVSLGEESSVWTQQHASSQSFLDGLFFESLVSQQLNLALWMHAASPQDTLRGMLKDLQNVAHQLCEETSQLAYANAARVLEQRAYKRRRSGIEAQTSKSRAKVASLEKLVMPGEGEVPPPLGPLVDGLGSWLLM